MGFTHNMNDTDRGDTLLEVVISTVIMGIVGVLLVSSIAEARPFADKMSLVGQTVQSLNTLAESINLQPFEPCSSTNPQPYLLVTPASNPQSSSTGLEISTSQLPPVLVNLSSQPTPYQAQLTAQGASGAVTWSVQPALPAGLILNQDTGLISGSTSVPMTGSYIFSAHDSNTSITKTLILTSASISVKVNNGVGWVPCESIAPATIVGVTPTGKDTKYSYSLPDVTNQSNTAPITVPQITKGSMVTIWNTSNAILGSMVPVNDSGAGTFTIPGSVISGSIGGFVNLSTIANVEQVTITTAVSTGSPLVKVITKALP